MEDEPRWDQSPEEEEFEGPVLPRRPVSDTAEMDITPMIDITFLLLIFFLVCSTTTQQTAVELPPARRGKGVSERTSAIITVAERGGPGPALVYLADGKTGGALPDDEDEQAALIADYVEASYMQGKSTVLVKAEKRVKTADTWRVFQAAGRVEGVDNINVGVLELE